MAKNSVAVGVSFFLPPVALLAISYRFAHEPDFPSSAHHKGYPHHPRRFRLTREQPIKILRML